MHHSHRNNCHPQHRVPRQPHRQTKDYHRTTNTTQAHIPSSKMKRNIIILQVNINGIKNKRQELKLLIYDTPKAKPPKVHNFTTVRNDRLHKQEVGSSNSVETTYDSPQQAYLRPLIHATQNFKWSRYTLTLLNISQ